MWGQWLCRRRQDLGPLVPPRPSVAAGAFTGPRATPGAPGEGRRGQTLGLWDDAAQGPWPHGRAHFGGLVSEAKDWAPEPMDLPKGPTCPPTGVCPCLVEGRGGEGGGGGWRSGGAKSNGGKNKSGGAVTKPQAFA